MRATEERGRAGRTSLSPSHRRCSDTGKPVSAEMRSLTSRTVQDSSTATVLQPTQPGRTVTRSHLCERQSDPQWAPRGGPRPVAPGPSALPGAITSPPWPASSPRARLRPCARAPGQGQPRRTERPGAGLEGGILMAQPAPPQPGSAAAPDAASRPSQGRDARGRRGRAGGTDRGCGRARARPAGTCEAPPACRDR